MRLRQHTNDQKKAFLPRKGMLKSIAGFTLIEITIAFMIFSVLMVGMGSVFVSVFSQKLSQEKTLSAVRSADWAMGFITNAVRLSSAVSSPGWAMIQTANDGTAVSFGIDTDGDSSADARLWYWRGNGGNFGNRDTIYKGVGMGAGTANSNRQELVNSVADNPSAPGGDPASSAPIFSIHPDMHNILIIQLTVRPNPSLPSNPQNNPNYILISELRVRN